MPVYSVTIVATNASNTVEQVRLIDAKNEARALSHVTKDSINVRRPTSAELVAMGADGVSIERAE